jgi:hypothetical protein
MKLNILSFIILSVLIYACSKKETDNQVDLLVAEVGPEKITFKQLEVSFLLDPQYAVRTPLRQARLSQLNYLIAEKYAYLAAEQAGLNSEPDILKKLEYIKKKEIIKSYLQQKFIDPVRVTELELQEGLHRAGLQIYVFNLFCPSLAEAQKMEQDLLSFKNNDDLFRQRGTELGWITFGILDEPIENAVYALQEGESSAIVNSVFGYHILKTDTIRSNPEFQAISRSLQEQQVTDIIRKRKANGEIQKFLAEMADENKIQIANRSLERLVQSFNTISPQQDTDPLVMAPPLQNNDLQNVFLTLADLQHEPLLKFGDEQLTIGGFLERLKEMPPYHRPYLKGRNRLVQSMIDMVRNDLLLRQAMAEGYAGKKEVREKYTVFNRELLAREFSNRYNDPGFRQNNPQEWERLQRIMTNVQEKYPQIIDNKNLYSNVTDPDSVLTVSPVPVFIQNRYIW